MSREVDQVKIRCLRHLASMLESDPETQADFAELGMDTAWCRDQAARVRGLIEMVEANRRRQ